MDFFDVLIRVSFLVSLALFGFFIGRVKNLDSKDISSLLVYFISPVVIFISVFDAPIENDYIYFLISSLAICTVASFLALLLGKLIWQDGTAYLFAFAGGTGNTGYFGLPIAIALFGAEGAAIAVFIIIGVNLYEFTIGYFLASRGRGTVKESLLKVAKIPTLYVFILALVLRWFEIELNESLVSSMSGFKGAYSILGMLIIGITLSKVKSIEIDMKYISFSLLWKFCIWPIIGVIIVYTLPFNLTYIEKAIILLMCSVPMAGNVVIISNDLGVHPEKAATAVMASTLLALLSVPIALSFI
ncbi:MAG: putative permease [Bermanella sp.]